MFKRALLAPFLRKKHAKQWGASSTPYTQCKVASGPAAATLVAPVAQPRPPPGDPGGDGDGDGDGPGGDAPDDPRRNVPYDTAIFFWGDVGRNCPLHVRPPKAHFTSISACACNAQHIFFSA